MSLTAYLKQPQGFVVPWFIQTFPYLVPLRTDWRSRVAGLPTVWPPTSSTPLPYSLVGMAVDYRIRYAMTLTPPEALVAYHGAIDYDAWRTPEALAAGEEPKVEIEIDGETGQVYRKFQPGAVTPTLVATLIADLAEIQPVGRWLDAEHETWLDRWCLVLAAFEVLFRSGYPVPLPPAVLGALAQGSLDIRRAELDEAAVADIGQLAQVFLSQDWPWERSPLAPSPWWPNPTFAGSGDIGGADADLIIEGCLIDIKTTIKPRDLDSLWVYQLLGYVLLDYLDWYRLDAIGIYLARQGALIRWSLAEWLPRLTGQPDVSLAAFREAFRGQLVPQLLQARRRLPSGRRA